MEQWSFMSRTASLYPFLCSRHLSRYDLPIVWISPGRIEPIERRQHLQPIRTSRITTAQVASLLAQVESLPGHNSLIRTACSFQLSLAFVSWLIRV